MNNTDELIAEYQRRISVMRAFKFGLPVDVQYSPGGGWHRCVQEPRWDWQFNNYRVADSP